MAQLCNSRPLNLFCPDWRALWRIDIEISARTLRICLITWRWKWLCHELSDHQSFCKTGILLDAARPDSDGRNQREQKRSGNIPCLLRSGVILERFFRLLYRLGYVDSRSGQQKKSQDNQRSDQQRQNGGLRSVHRIEKFSEKIKARFQAVTVEYKTRADWYFKNVFKVIFRRFSICTILKLHFLNMFTELAL